MVSSTRTTQRSSRSTNTKSGRALVSRISGGIVFQVGGLSTALREGKSTNSFTCEGKLLVSPLVTNFKALSCIPPCIPPLRECNRTV